MQSEGNQKENTISEASKSRLIAAWESGRYIAGESIDINLDLATKQWLQDYVEPEVNIENKITNIDTAPINKFDTHGNVFAWMDSFQILLYTKHAK